jgi:hypothetical protein
VKIPIHKEVNLVGDGFSLGWKPLSFFFFLLWPLKLALPFSTHFVLGICDIIINGIIIIIVIILAAFVRLRR